MHKIHYTTRQYRVVAGLLIALAAPALAQVPPLPFPGLPLPPGADANLDGGSNAATIALPAPNNAENAALPPPLALPAPPAPDKEKKEQAKSAPNPSDLLPQALLDKADPPKKATPDSDDMAENDDADTAENSEPDKEDAPSDTTATALVPPPAPFAGAPVLAIPGAPSQGPNLPVPAGGTFGDALSAGAAALDSAPDGPKKTWQTTLAPSRTYPSTKFNYKRVALPSTVYRKGYSTQNRHLPVRRTQTDYDQQFIYTVARNDINGTRALLNSGRNVNQQDANGDSALIVAIRSGAFDTARLLLARGANAGFYGRGGKTAFHYARMRGNTEFAKLLVKSGG